jgi:hypothetical protein
MAGAQVKETAPVNPPNPVTSTGNDPVAPRATLMAAAEIEKSHACADSGTVATLPPVCVIVRLPATGPGGVAATGLKVTVTMHAAPAGAITIGNAPLLQAAVMEVSVNNPGAAAIDAMLSGKLPLLPIETVPVVDVVSNAPGRVRLVGVTVMLDAVAEPLPESATSIGCPMPSRASKTCKVVARAPDADGVKVTPTVQEEPAGTDAGAPHVPAVVAKSAVLPPVLDAAGVRETADAVLFVIVTNCGSEVAPINCVPKLMLVGE